MGLRKAPADLIGGVIMYFFEREYVCPKCGAKKMFYVYGRTDASEKFAVFSSAYKPAKSWSEVDDKVIVTMYCDKCWSTDTQIYDFEGNLLV